MPKTLINFAEKLALPLTVAQAEKLVDGATDDVSRQQAFTAIREARKALDEAEDEADWPKKMQ